MDTYLAVASKRDWRSYADRPVPEDVRGRILDGGRLSGSAVNKQPWRFVVVESAEAKERIAGMVYAAANVETCAFAVAIAIGRPSAFKRANTPAPPGTAENEAALAEQAARKRRR